MKPIIQSIVLSAVMLSAVTAMGQEASEGQAEAELSTHLIEPPRFAMTAIEARWGALRRSAPNSDDETEAFATLDETRIELGIVELYDQAMTLLVMAERAREAEDLVRAEQLRLWAAQLAPLSSEPDFFLAHMTWSSSPFSVGTTLSALSRAYELAGRTPGLASVIGVHARLTFVRIVIIVALAFLLIQVRRYIKLLAHDFAFMFTRIIPRYQAWIGLMLLLALPAVLLWSPLILVLTLAIALVTYQNHTERAVVAILTLSLLAAPSVFERMGQLVAASDSLAQEFYRLQTQFCDESCIARLDTLHDRRPEDQLATLTLASALTRTGMPANIDRALITLDQSEFTGDLRGLARLTRANLLQLDGQLTEAASEYNTLIAEVGTRRDILTAAHFNLSRVLRDWNRIEGADEQIALASRIDQARVVDLIQNGSRRTNRWLIYEQPSGEDLIGIALNDGAPHTELAVEELWRPYGGRLSRSTLPLVVILSLLLMGGIVALKRRMRPSESCGKCGKVMSHREAPDATQAGYCPDCFRLFMMGPRLDETDRQSLERAVDNRTKSDRVILILGNILVSGLGSLWRGRAATGAPLFAMFIAGVVILFNEIPTIGPAIGIGWTVMDGREIVAILLLVIAYVASWVVTWLQRKTS